MEAFSLLKYWKGGGGGSVSSVGGGGSSGEDSGGVRGVNASRHANTPTTVTTTILDAANHAVVETDEDEDDEGPFFDLEFALPEGDDDDDDEDETLERENDSGCNEQNHGSCCAEVVEVEEVVVEGENDTVVESSSGDGERKFKFTLSSSSSASAASNNTTTTTSSCSYNDCADPNLPLSPSDELFFKGRLVPVETSSEVLITGTDGVMNSKAHQFQVASLLKPATKFRVFMSDRLKKSRLQPSQQPPKQNEENEHQKQSNHSISNKFFTVKCKVEEVPFVSLFTRDNSSRGGGGAPPSKPQTQKETAEETATEKRNSKDVVQKYLKKVKPLYIRVSNRVVEKKLRLVGQLTLNSVSSDSGRKQTQPPESGTIPKKKETDSSSSAKSEKGEGRKVVVIVEEDGNVVGESKGMSSSCTGVGVKHGGSNLASGFKVMCKHLGKSKSASSAVVHSVPPTGATAGERRRDDSLLQQQDGIQSAILHCKRSFKASRDSESATVLSRSASEPPYHEKSSEDGNNNIVALEEVNENSTVAQ